MAQEMNDRRIQRLQQSVQVIGIFRRRAGDARVGIIHRVVASLLQPVLKQSHPQAVHVQTMHQHHRFPLDPHDRFSRIVFW